MRIRTAHPDDAKAILAIYAPIVEQTTISFELNVPDEAEMRRRIQATLQLLPWLVGEDDQGAVNGYVYAGRFRERAAYQWAVEVTAYVRADCRGQGVGRRLYERLFELLREGGYFQAVAGIALPNAASVGLHEAMGFKPVAHYPAVGYKHGAWRDMGYWQKGLQEPGAGQKPVEPKPLRPFTTVPVHPEIKRYALPVEALSADAFAAFGDVIEASPTAEHYPINAGFAERYNVLARLNTGGDDGQPVLSIFRAKARPLDAEAGLPLSLMERHLLGSQAFMPLGGQRFLVVVATPGAPPTPAQLRCFLAAPGQGVNYGRGTWHHPLLALDADGDFLVIDRAGPGAAGDCEELALDAGTVWVDGRGLR